MIDYFIYYASSNIVGVLIFGVMLAHDRLSVDRQEKQLKYDQVSTDPLTKLNNRGQLVRYVSQESNLRIEGRQTYIIMMDINYFKKINDTYGHAEGDRRW